MIEVTDSNDIETKYDKPKILLIDMPDNCEGVLKKTRI